jgi:hypothetical protein
MKIDTNTSTWTGINFSLPDAGYDHRKFFDEQMKNIIAFYYQKAVYTNSPFIEIESPCGHKMNIKSPADFPMIDVPCPCGDPSHYMVKWSVREDEEAAQQKAKKSS